MGNNLKNLSQGVANPGNEVVLRSGLTEETEPTPIENNQIGDADAMNNKLKLYQKLDNMPPFKRMVFLKMMQFRVISDVLSAVENGKNTPKSVWRSVIGRLYAIKDINVGKDKSGIDFRKVIATLLPIIGTLAGLFLALRESEKAERNAAEPEQIEEINTEAQKYQSIVLQMCKSNQNGFSLHA